MSVFKYVAGYDWRSTLEAFRTQARAPTRSQPPPRSQPSTRAGRKRKQVEEDTSGDENAEDERPAKKSTKKSTKPKSEHLAPPVMAATDIASTAIIPNQELRPKRYLTGAPATQQVAVLSDAEVQEMATLLRMGDRCLAEPSAANVNLERTPRFSLEYHNLVIAIAITQRGKKKAAENALDPGRPPISTIAGIFDDMADNASKLNLQGALPPFPLRIASMCSGTEAPFLGMQLMQQALARRGDSSFQVAHVFSAEIETFKQAYIERNFSPPLLFRDVTEFHENKNNGKVHTAYGGLATPPQDVHILVAGSSCVDYSSLNTKTKNFREKGQSYSTLQGIQSYAKSARPGIIILENVSTAPWHHIKDFLSEVGYISHHVLVDTKNFYLPQTRQRGYLIALDKEHLEGSFDLKLALQEWEKLMTGFQRRANVPFPDFIYNDDDPRLLEGSSDANTTNKTMDWAACRHRYAKLRVEKLYGSQRPMTHWQNNGSCKFPDFGWIKWSKVQRERIWDTLDIEYLRHAAERDYDINYKSRWLELSQNVDRDPDARQWGIVPCLTPSGIPYLTTRGGPVLGVESLLLQGIPTYALNLTKETPRQLQDLAGNAMSVPVVTAAIMSGILAVRKGMEAECNSGQYLKDFSKHDKLRADTEIETAETTPAARSLSDLLQDMSDHRTASVPTGTQAASDVQDILHEASTTLQFCKCEGNTDLKRDTFQICEDCGHTTCKTCGQNPAHKYHDIAASVTASRGSPARFITTIKNALPAVLELTLADGNQVGTSLDPLPKYQSCTDEFREAARLALRSTVTFKHVRRGHCWKVTFEGQHARLELRISRKCCPSAISESDFFGREAVECHWLLYAKANTEAEAGSDVRAALEVPIARMTPHTTLLAGMWETMRYSRILLDIQPATKAEVPSWENSIGLQHDYFRGSMRAAALQVSVSPMESDQAKEAARSVTGTYVLRPQCGSASASLHVRYKHMAQNVPLMFFFLEPEQLKNELFDPFVFSTTSFRRGYKEHRLVEAEVDQGWRPFDPRDPNEQDAATAGTSQAKGNTASRRPQADKILAKAKEIVAKTRAELPATTFRTWVSCDALTLTAPAVTDNYRLCMTSNLEVTMDNNAVCKHESSFMLIELPIDTYKGSDWKSGYQFPVQLVDRKTALDNFQWLLERAAGPMLNEMGNSQPISVGNSAALSCSTCAPRKPSVVFDAGMEAAAKRTQGPGKREKKAMEVGRQATDYEQALKLRPSPVVAAMHCHERSGILEVKLNIPALCHQVMAKLCISQDEWQQQQPVINWRLARDTGSGRAPKFNVRPFLDNEGETSCPKPKDFKRGLWQAQSKALAWMVRQELSPPQWHEQEREEASIPALGCRIVVNARVPKQIRGGVLADEVGGGKTTTSLALVAKMLELRKEQQMPDKLTSMSVDATLILVPQNLVSQWEGEANACFGADNGNRRLVIKTVDQLLKLTVSDLRQKDVILTSWNLFDKPLYWSTLQRLCDAPDRPLKAGREFQQRLHAALEELANGTPEAREDVAHDAREQSQRVPLFHACTFRRIIIDEYSYLEGFPFLACLELKTLSMWLLSGTPPTATFDAVNTTAKLLKTKLASEDEGRGRYLSFTAKGSRQAADMTDAEQFHWYKDEHSPAWYRARNRLVNTFVEKYFRENSAKAARSIPKVSHFEVSLLSAHEQLVYFEVFQRLMSQNIKFLTKPKNISGMTRGKRLDMTVSVSEHPEDALLSCCSEVAKIYPAVDAETDPEQMCTPVIAETRAAIEGLTRELYENLKEAFAYQEKRSREEEDPADNPHFLSFQLRIRDSDVGDKLAAELIDRVMTEAYLRKTLPQVPYVPRASRGPAQDAESGAQAGDQEGDEDPVADDDDDMPEPEDDDDGGEIGGTAADGAKKSKASNAKYLAQFLTSLQPVPHFNQKTKQTEFHRADLKVRVNELKSRSADMNMTTIDLVGHVRVLRLFSNIRRVLGEQDLPPCSGCGRLGPNIAGLHIMGLCGHVACHHCLLDQARRSHDPDGCLDSLCDAPCLPHHLIGASRFSPSQMSLTTAHGSKMDAVVARLEDIIESSSDSILVFVQFPRVLKALIRALTASQVDFQDAASSDQSDTKVEAKIEGFRKGDARVLLLDIDSPNAAGWNLQRANHVMFVSAYFAPSQAEYRATMTQAIGRVHRFGQAKPVHIYHFLMARTIEVNIIEDREGKAIVKQEDGTFTLKDRHGSESTIWAGRDMKGAASAAGDINVAALGDKMDSNDGSDAESEFGAEDASEP